MLDLLEMIFGTLGLIVDVANSIRRANAYAFRSDPDYRLHYSDWKRNHPVHFR